MEIIISNSSGIPIYEQIKEQIKAKIISEELEEGRLLPSIRNLAKDLGCSVITTKNAYLELEKEGYIYIIPAKGAYVANLDKDILKDKKLSQVEELLAEGIKLAKTNKISKDEVIEIINILYEEEK